MLKAGPRRLAKARTDFVRGFDGIMADHQLRGEEAYSNVAVARACGVDEKTVRQWRSGEKQLRVETVALFPGRLRDEVIGLIRNLEGRSPDRALVQLGKALDAVDQQIAGENPDDAHPVIDRAIVRLLDAKRKVGGVR